MRKKDSQVRIVLASASPRRSKILRDLNVRFSLTRSNIKEIPMKGEKPRSFVMRIAKEKALKAALRYKSGIIMGCDTIVVINRTILGKPKSSMDAVRMLRILNGRWHRVFSAICLYDVREKEACSGCSVTKVKFKLMNEEEIAWYVQTGEPLDKAGSYGIQEAGMLFIEKIDGSYTGVAGLPVELFGTLLKNIGIDVLSLIRHPF